MCAWMGHSETCKFRIGWAAKFSWKLNACELAHDLVLKQCPMCSNCTLAAADCQAPATKVKYDCMSGFFNWQRGWSTDKKAWCCKTKKVACEEQNSSTIRAASPLTTMSASTTQKSTSALVVASTKLRAATVTTTMAAPVNPKLEKPDALMLPKMACSSLGCDVPFIGVNLGGWLLLEDWIWSTEMRLKKITDEWTLIQNKGGPQNPSAISLMHEHWDNFVSEKDLDHLQNFGVTHVRIPLGWWIVDYDAADGFVNGGERYLFRVLLWLKKRNMQALLDLHAVPGGQVEGSSFTGKRFKTPGFFTSTANFVRGKRAMHKLAVLIAAYETDKRTAGVVMGMELLNEPSWAYWDSSPGIQEVYGTMIPEIRKILPAKRYLLFLSLQERQGKRRSSEWLVMMRKRDPKNFEGVVYDAHMYHSYGDDDMNGRIWRKQEDSCKTCCRDPALLDPIVKANVPISIGEYSLNTGFPGNNKFFKHYMGEQLSLFQNTPHVIGSFFWNHRIDVGPDGYFKEFSLLDLIGPKGPIPSVHNMDLRQLCPHQDVSRCPRYDPKTVAWNEECFWLASK